MSKEEIINLIKSSSRWEEFKEAYDNLEDYSSEVCESLFWFCVREYHGTGVNDIVNYFIELSEIFLNS